MSQQAIVELELHSQPASRPWFAVRDAARKNADAKWTYTCGQRAEAETIRQYMAMAYDAEATYINFRKGFIAIKAANARRSNKDREELFKGIVAERGYELVHTPQALIVRIPR